MKTQNSRLKTQNSKLKTQNSKLMSLPTKFLFIFFFLIGVSSLHASRSLFKLNQEAESTWLELGGEIEAEFVVSRRDNRFAYNSSNVSPPISAGDGVFQTVPGTTRLRFDKIALNPILYYPNKAHDFFRVEAELNFLSLGSDGSSSDNAFAKECYFVFNLSNLTKGAYVKVGLDAPFFTPYGDPNARITEVYPINGTAFWRDEDWQVQVGADIFSFLYVKAAVSDGLTLNDMAVGKSATYQILHDARATDDVADSQKQGTAGIGLKFGDQYKVDFLAFGTYSRLSKDDETFLEEVYHLRGSGGNRLGGANLGVEFPVLSRKVELFGQGIYTRRGHLDRLGYYGQVAVNLFDWAQVLFRYNKLEVATSSNFLVNIPLMWDRSTYTGAINISLYNGLTLKNEVHFNKELSGSSVRNDEVVSQLEWVF